MKRLIIAFILLLGFPFTVAACLWDRDTPASEARGMPEVVAVLTGRFPRNPPLYYAIRLKRVAAEIQEHPDHLEAYDDAGVACDRLGRGDEAIVWMERKRKELAKLDPALPEMKEQSYRYHANLGTFLVHRWIRNGADRSRIQEVATARDEIAKALEINPNAHFGREKYQLAVLKWIVDLPRGEGFTGGQPLPNLLGWPYEIYAPEPVTPKEADEAVRGLSGLIVLGNAWESVDVFYALDLALQRDSLGFPSEPKGGRNTLAYFAWLRSLELIDAGKGSILPKAPRGEDLKACLTRPDFYDPAELLKTAFHDLRIEAEAWNKARDAFMTKRLKEGRHPDVDRDFWEGYHEAPAPTLPKISIVDSNNAYFLWRTRRALALVVGIPCLALSIIGFVAFRVRKVRRWLFPLEVEGSTISDASKIH